MEITKEQINKIEKFVKEKLDELNYTHTIQVRDIALEIQKKEGGDKKIIEAAALLHDIGKAEEFKGENYNHHEISAKVAEEFLNKINIDKESIKKIIGCIKTHMGPSDTLISQFSDKVDNIKKYYPRPKTDEEKIVYDADMINFCGPFGVVKRFYLGAKTGKNFVDIIKSKKIHFSAYNDLQTETGKKIGKKYFEATKKFFEVLGI